MFPLIIETKYFALHSLWFFFAIAVLVGVFSTIKLTLKNGLKVNFLSQNILKFMFWGIIGARIAYITENYHQYFYDLSKNTILQILYIWDEGLSFWGAAIAILAFLYYKCRKEDQNFYRWIDVIIPSIILGIAIGALGTFFDGINYGHETGLPWGVNFENPAIKYTVPIHPTQIYAFLYSVAIATSLILLNDNKKIQSIKLPGFLGLLGAITFLIFRFLEEFVRGDDTLIFFGIRMPMVLAATLAIFTSTIFILRYNNRKKIRRKS